MHLNKASGIIDYELSDHLGNVRATFKYISSGVAQLTSRTDYYSFGGPMPGRSYNLGTYRFNYQGQESAVNQSWTNFELRMYNPDLGRFCNPDPMGQFASAYVGMGNNPVSGIDPTGGYVNGGTVEQWHQNYYRLSQQEQDDRFLQRGKYDIVNIRKNLALAKEDLLDRFYGRGKYRHTGLDVGGRKVWTSELDEQIKKLEEEYYGMMPQADGTDGGLFGFNGEGGGSGPDEGWWASLSIVMGARERHEQYKFQVKMEFEIRKIQTQIEPKGLFPPSANFNYIGSESGNSLPFDRQWSIQFVSPSDPSFSGTNTYTIYSYDVRFEGGITTDNFSKYFTANGNRLYYSWDAWGPFGRQTFYGSIPTNPKIR